MPPRGPQKLRVRGADDVLSYSALPSWTLSVALHVLLILLLLSWGAGHGGVKDGSSEMKEVGLYVKGAEEAHAAEDAPATGTDETAPEAPRVERAADAATSLEMPNEAPAIKLDLPAKQLLGPGAGGPLPLPAGVLADSQKPRQNPGTAQAGGALGSNDGAQGLVPFFQIQAHGSRVVYVIDSSGSMSDYNAIGVARAELLSSLQHINAKKEFQVIFYNTKLHPMLPPGSRKSELQSAKLMRGTEINQTLARQFIEGIQPDSGTDHFLALKFALMLKPDLIFFLTDAKEPELSVGELLEIKNLNKGRAKIHAIEFGKGAPLSVTNFLKKLAQQNDGSYRYRDVTTFDRKRGLE